jgi:phage terminase small subunit
MPARRNSGGLRKPTALRKAEGSYREDLHGDRLDNAYPSSGFEQPAGLGTWGIKLWRQVIDYSPAEVLRTLDSSGLEKLCRAWQVWKDWDRKLKKDKFNATLFNTWLKSSEHFDRLSREFGIGPISRARMQIPKVTKEAENPLTSLRLRMKEID